MTAGRIEAVCVSGVRLIDLPGRGARPTGIDKRPVEGPISVGGIPAVFLMKSLIPVFCVLLLIQSVACLLRELARLRA